MPRRRKYRFAYAVAADYVVDETFRSEFEPREGELWASWIGDAKLYRSREQAEEACERYSREEHERYIRRMDAGEWDRIAVYYGVVEVKYAVTGAMRDAHGNG